MGQAQLPPRADAHVRVADLDRPELSAEDAHHLESVLRLGSGRLVSATDGVGRWRLCVFCPSRPPRPPRLDPDGPIMTEPAPSYPVTVAVALTKADKPEWAVQRLTEAGVDRILLFEAARSVVRWDPAKAGAKR
ncbi:MAG: 16S rRNA (uracil(1498)-N(3))-methyltransferase, partial [Acidimicrobiales bacterium]